MTVNHGGVPGPARCEGARLSSPARCRSGSRLARTMPLDVRPTWRRPGSARRPATMCSRSGRTVGSPPMRRAAREATRNQPLRFVSTLTANQERGVRQWRRACEPDLVHPRSHEEARQAQDLLCGKQLAAWRQLHALGWHAVLAAQIAALGQRDAEVGVPPPKRVHQHRVHCPGRAAAARRGGCAGGSSLRNGCC